jgi:hypothetical protein
MQEPTGPGWKRIARAPGADEPSALERIMVLDPVRSTPRVPEPLVGRLDVLRCAPLLAAAIRRLHVDGSLVELER